jgi:hypothetical protein
VPRLAPGLVPAQVLALHEGAGVDVLDLQEACLRPIICRQGRLYIFLAVCPKKLADPVFKSWAGIALLWELAKKDVQPHLKQNSALHRHVT